MNIRHWAELWRRRGDARPKALCARPVVNSAPQVAGPRLGMEFSPRSVHKRGLRGSPGLSACRISGIVPPGLRGPAVETC